MQFRRIGVVVGTAIVASGCSAYPLPQDVTGDNTYDIVRSIRCEARDALRGILLAEIIAQGAQPTYRDFDGMKTGTQLADELARNAEKYSQLKPERFEEPIIDRINYYKSSTISYDFSLKGTENNIQGLDVGLFRSVPGQIFRTGVGFSGDRTREVLRTFVVRDHAIKLFQKKNRLGVVDTGDRLCGDHHTNNIIYPIGHEKKIFDLFNNFMRINLDQSLDGGDSKPNVRFMSDRILFKTKIATDASPGFTFSPLGTALNVSSLTVTNANFREDAHQATVTISASPVPGSLGGRRRSRAVDEPSYLTREEESIRAERQVQQKNFDVDIRQLSDSIQTLAR